MRRTTAGINFFRVSSRKKNSEEEDEKSGQAEEWSPEIDEPRDASSTLKETVADNKELRTANVIKEKVFDIELDEPLFEMRKDTSLVIVDIPGLNEAGTSDMYLNYVSRQWDTYDCVVVVMDAEKGVNTEEQVSLLNFVKEKQQKVRDVPVVVLCNKVDDPDNEEMAVLVDEVRAKVEQVFAVDCRKAALNKIVSPTTVPTPSSEAKDDDSSEKEDDTTQGKVSGDPPETKPFGSGVTVPASGSGDSTAGATKTPGVGIFGGTPSIGPPVFGSPSNPFAGVSFAQPLNQDRNEESANPASGFGSTSASGFGFAPAPSPKFSFGSNSTGFSPGPNPTRANKRTGAKKFHSTHSAPTSKAADSPVFIPISAENAFIYRTVSHLPFEEFKKLDTDIIERLGREEAGRIRWKAMSLEEKYKVVHDVVSDPSAYKERLATTNFDAFLKTLSHFVGGKHTQTKLLEKQIDIAVKKLSGSKKDIAGQLRSIYERSKVLGKPTSHMKSHFWNLYKSAEVTALGNFFTSMSPQTLYALYTCIDELAEYSKDQNSVLYADGTANALKEENLKIVSTMKDLVKRQIGMILDQYSTWKIGESSMMTTSVAQLSHIQSNGRALHLTLRSPNGRGDANYSLDPNANSKPPESNPFYWQRDPNSPALGSPNTASSFWWRNILTGASVKSRKNPELPAPTWSNLSPDDWIAIVNSISLLVYEKQFSENFGPELNELELLKAEVTPLLANGTRKQYL